MRDWQKLGLLFYSGNHGFAVYRSIQASHSVGHPPWLFLWACFCRKYCFHYTSCGRRHKEYPAVHSRVRFGASEKPGRIEYQFLWLRRPRYLVFLLFIFVQHIHSHVRCDSKLIYFSIECCCSRSCIFIYRLIHYIGDYILEWINVLIWAGISVDDL